nr:sugar kinase [Streptomyces tumemacerans]
MVLGLDIGGTTVKTALLARDGTVVAEGRCATGPERGGAAVLATVLEQAAYAVGEAGAMGVTVRAAGIAACGLVDEERGTVEFAPHIGWQDVPLRRLAADRLGLPVALGHDVRAGGLAEARRGAGRGEDVVFFVPLGTGVGGAVLWHGRPLPGSHWRSAEIGHVVLRPGGDVCTCGQRGCLDTFAGGTAIAQRYLQQCGPAAGGPASGVDTAEVARRAAAGDQVAARVWGEAIEALAQALVAGITLFDPGVLILGGGLSQAGDQLLVPLRRQLERRMAFQVLPRLVRAELGEAAGRIGAGLLAWDLAGGPAAPG